MKSAAINSTTVEMLHKIEAIEKEVKGLKLTVLKKLTSNGKKVIKLKGIIKGVDITDEDITSVKKTLYSRIGI
ncbi:MAG: hypothetical protein A2X59_12770 [Nitrospirae bacterium GWC2_42_7]|nr:MAG: hypothetical protein A2X59_12770 [Nitrospirae bacterium GWC2_42_7]